MLLSGRLSNVALGKALKCTRAVSLSTSSFNSENYQFENLNVSSPRENVLHVELNRPDKRNAMTAEMWQEIISCFNSASNDPCVRAIVLSGRGKIFTAGLDLMAAAGHLTPNPDLDTARNAFKFLEFIKFAQESITVVEKCRKPVIAAIHNACIGGGVDLTTACDIRLCTRDAYFCVKEVDVGLAADIGTLQRLPKVIGNDSLARELCYTARNLESLEAEKVGLVSHVYENQEDLIKNAIEMAAHIATKSPVAVQGTKIHLNYSRDHTTDEGLQYMATWNAAMLQTEDIMKSAEAFMMKKPTSEIEYSKL